MGPNITTSLEGKITVLKLTHAHDFNCLNYQLFFSYFPFYLHVILVCLLPFVSDRLIIDVRYGIQVKTATNSSSALGITAETQASRIVSRLLKLELLEEYRRSLRRSITQVQTHNEAFAIITQATLRSQPPLLDRNVAVMDVGHSLERMDLDAQGSSLSVDAECSAHIKHEVESEQQLGCLDLRSKKSIWQKSSLSRQTEKPKGTHRSLSVPSKLKSRQHLRLSSFKTLGIAPYTDALLTPPDEASLIHWNHPSSDMSVPPSSQPAQGLTGIVSQATLPQAPVFSGSISEQQSNASTTASAVPTIAVRTDDKDGGGSPSSGDEAPTTPSWIESGTNAIGTLCLHGQPQNASLT